MTDAATPRASVEDTRSRILAATRELYAHKGSRGTTTREVAERAGVNEATLFRHFGTKGQLIAAMLDVYCNRMTYPDLMSSLEGPLENDLQRLMLASIESITLKEDLIKVGLAEEFTNPDGGHFAFRGPNDVKRAFVEYFRQRVEAGELRGKPEFLARMFMSFSFSYVMARRMWSEHTSSLDELVPAVVDIFLNGARAH